MGLYLADCHLEYARLAIADRAPRTEDGTRTTQQDSHITSAAQHLTIAKEMIARMGYHRRDNAVAELERALGM